MKRKPNEIHIPDRIRQEYGDVEQLAESLQNDGQFQPICIDEKNVLIDGGRRLEAWESVYGEKPIDVYVYGGGLPTMVAEIKAEATTKKFTSKEVYEAGQVLEGYYKPIHEKERVDGRSLSTQIESEDTPKTDIAVAKDLGVSKGHYQRVKAVMNPELDTEVGEETATEIREKAQTSVRGAYEDLLDIRTEKNMEERDDFYVDDDNTLQDLSDTLINYNQQLAQINSILDDVLENWDDIDGSVTADFMELVIKMFTKIKNHNGGEEWKTKLLQ